jgi:preprotein translocase subunit SecA
MKKVFRFLGLSVGLIQATLTEEERKEEYMCDITYATNAEVRSE